MRNWMSLLVFVVLAGTGFAFSMAKRPPKVDPKLTAFREQADGLIVGLQQYKEFIGSFPKGSNLEVARSLNGQGDKRILIVVGRKGDLNSKGEFVDPWGTPIQFYFSADGVMVRSAGPNQIFEDCKMPGTDDLFRTN
jgi:hypothetical protein